MFASFIELFRSPNFIAGVLGIVAAIIFKSVPSLEPLMPYIMGLTLILILGNSYVAGKSEESFRKTFEYYREAMADGRLTVEESFMLLKMLFGFDIEVVDEEEEDTQAELNAQKLIK